MDTSNIGKVTWIEFEKCFRRFAMKNMALKRLQVAGNIIENCNVFDEREEFSKLCTKGKLHAIRVGYDNMVLNVHGYGNHQIHQIKQNKLLVLNIYQIILNNYYHQNQIILYKMYLC